jgi:FkbM family methyltransferase
MQSNKKMLIPKIIHFMVPDRLSELQSEVLRTARRLHPSWEIKVWTDADRLELISLVKNETFGNYYGSALTGAQKADIARLWILWQEGGVYLDSDVLLWRSLDPLLLISGKVVLCSEDGYNCSNAFFASPPKHPGIGAVIEYLSSNEPDWTLPPNQTTGPKLFSRIFRYRTDTYCLPREAFYPYNFNESRPEKFRPEIFGIHEWSGSWKIAHEPIKNRQTLKRRIKSALRPLAKKAVQSSRAILKRAFPDLFAAQKATSYFNGRRVITLHESGVMVALAPLDNSLTPRLALTGSFEKLEEAFILQEVRGGDWFIDAGGNIGLMTLLAARNMGPFGRAFYFEPNPASVECLRVSASINWMADRILVHQCALSELDGFGHMEGDANRLGEYRLKQENEGDGFLVHSTNLESIEVAVRRLDDIIPFNVPIKLMKLDVEGHETQVLRGARRLLESHSIETLLFEYGSESYGPSFSKFAVELKTLQSLGYVPYRLLQGREGKIICVPWPSFLSEPPELGHVPLVMRSDRFVQSGRPRLT